MAKMTVAFSCDTERDRDILQWLDRLAADNINKSESIRQALRAGASLTATNDDILAELSEIKRLMRRGVAVSQGNEPDQDQAADPMVGAAQDALNSLGI